MSRSLSRLRPLALEHRQRSEGSLSAYRLPLVGWAQGELVSLKRMTELVVTLLTAPVWGTAVAILWLAVKCTDPHHPAFFLQPRTGMHGKRFDLIKLRTMVPNAAQLQADLAQFNATKDGTRDFKMVDDPRVTPIGRVLRKTHLDELPQLINVLKGDMSLVGPRPNSSIPVTEYHDWWLPRLSARPGVTGLGQINRAEAHDFADRVRLELRYNHSQSFWLDSWIVWRTFIVALISRKGL